MAKATAVEGSAQADIAALTPEQIRDILEQNATLVAAEELREQNAKDGVAFDISANGYLSFKCSDWGNGKGAQGTRQGWEKLLDCTDQIRATLAKKGAEMDANYQAYLAARKSK